MRIFIVDEFYSVNSLFLIKWLENCKFINTNIIGNINSYYRIG